MDKAIFRAAEALDMAIQIEQQGIAFYKAGMEMIDSADLKAVFSFLIHQEHIHRDVFSKMKADLSELRLPESYSGEYERYMTTFVKEKVFFSPEQAAEKVRSLGNAGAAVDWAVTFEQRSIAFYRLIKDHVRASESAAIERIISEERHHIERLHDLRQKIDNKPFDPTTA